MPTILIVEDEEDLRKGLEINIAKEGWRVVQAADGETGMNLALKDPPDLIILDVMLPGMNGFDVCRELRRRGFDAPIIMLTAKSEEIDRVVGLEIGADDYVTKPFSVRELMARVRVCLRRNAARPTQSLARSRFGEIEIDFEQFRATRDGEPLELSVKEYEILRLLIRHRGQVVTRDQLMSEVWGYENPPSSRTVDNHILKLRKKLEDDPNNPSYILSIYGQGYKFVA